MKVVFLSFFSGVHDRGVETFVHELSKQLVTNRVEVLVFQNGPRRENSPYETVSTEFPVQAYGNPSQFCGFLDKYSLMIKKFTQYCLDQLPADIDIVVANNGGWQSFLCRIWCSFHNARLVIVGQTGPGIDERFNLYCFPDCFVALSDFQLTWAKKVNPLVRLVKITNGVNSAVFAPQGLKFSLNLPHPIFLCVAALVPIKRQDLAIRAVSRLSKGSLVLVGQGISHDYLQNLGEKLLPKRFQILDIPYTQIPEIYRAADILPTPLLLMRPLV